MMRLSKQLARQLCALAFFSGAPHAEMNWQQHWQLEAESGFSQASTSPLFASQNQTFNDMALRWFPQTNQWQAQLVALKQNQQTQLRVAELFWSGEVKGKNLLIGKQRLNLGVGYGFRPLDIFSPYQRNPIAIQVEQGLAVVSLSQFSDADELSLFYTDAYLSHDSAAFAQRGIGIRNYRLTGHQEWQGLAYVDNQRGLNLGGSWITTLGDAWELHAESRYQQYYSQMMSRLDFPPLDRQAAIIEQQFANAWQTLFGMTWTNLVGDNLIIEYWFDNRALSLRQWRAVTQLSRDLQVLGSQFDPLRLSQAAVFQGNNLVQHNLLLHWHRDLTDWQPALDLLFSPSDGGLISTAKINYEFSQGWTLGAQLRYLGGKNDAVYQLLPERYIGLIKLEARF
ncbi:hypothetical protein [Agarivorans sp. QJM3NY_33]|uniref:hypothetical protein n=1 Tax=Agarivorans sp. QJM3NY_33 TaxID=3421432 RepID=UPI003D7EFE45